MSDYKRLTEVKNCNDFCFSVDCEEDCDTCYFGLLHQRLAELEDKIENGTLVELPCKVGDKVYYLSGKTIREEVVTNVECVINYNEIMLLNSYIFTNDPDDRDDNCYRLSKLGKSLFLTKAEAEAKLEQSRKENNNEQ